MFVICSHCGNSLKTTYLSLGNNYCVHTKHLYNKTWWISIKTTNSNIHEYLIICLFTKSHANEIKWHHVKTFWITRHLITSCCHDNSLFELVYYICFSLRWGVLDTTICDNDEACYGKAFWAENYISTFLLNIAYIHQI
jgi:hypothetical protein